MIHPVVHIFTKSVVFCFINSHILDKGQFYSRAYPISADLNSKPDNVMFISTTPEPSLATYDVLLKLTVASGKNSNFASYVEDWLNKH